VGNRMPLLDPAREGYRFCLAKYQVGAVGAAADATLPRIICGPCALADQLKWSLRVTVLSRRVWHDLGRLTVGETLQFAQTTLGVTAGARGESAERELLRALMLAYPRPTVCFRCRYRRARLLIGRDFRIASRPSRGVHYIFRSQAAAGTATANSVSARHAFLGPGERIATA
jgi:hypothetical protein